MITRIVSFIAAVFLPAAASTACAQRLTTELASDWKFIKQDAGVLAATTNWESVTIPHTWNAVDGQDGGLKQFDDSQYTNAAAAADAARKAGKNGYYYRGACWYARPLDAPADWKGKRVFVRFEAAALVARIYLNGELLGEHRGGFTAFCYELTSRLRFGAANELRVQVDNSRQEDVPPLSGDFNIDGGIYRPAQLIVMDSVGITPLDFASPGVYLTTKSLNKKSATVEVKSLISNGGDSSAKVTLETEIKDASGKSVCALSSQQSIEAGKTKPVIQTPAIAKPHLWNGRKDPYLYTATVRVVRDGKTMDEVSQPLGLRTFAISRKQGFLLNGEPYPVHGVNRHQDYFKKGWALSPADHEEDARIICDLGATAIRLAHYPQSEYFHDLCDRNGLLLWNEVSLVNTIRDTPRFAANAEQQLREMILQRYNHPSVAFWGTFNELENEKTPSPDVLLRRLKEVIHELDPNRIDVGASDHSPRSYNRIPTGICHNGYPGWYGKAMPDDMTNMIDGWFKESGQRIGISEYGGGGNPFMHQEGGLERVLPYGQFHPEEWQTYIHERAWTIIQNNPKVWGSFLWVMFDFSSSHRNEGGQPGLNDKGLVTQDRNLKKDAYFFYRANWNPEPMVYIASRRMTPRKLAATDVQIFSNADEVELKVNGKSLGIMKPDDIKVCRWPDVSLTPGKNQIEAIGRGKNSMVTDSCEWTLEP